jgi:hypothetical protein
MPARQPRCRGEAGGFNAVQELLTNRDSRRLTRSDDSRAMPSAETVTARPSVRADRNQRRTFPTGSMRS